MANHGIHETFASSVLGMGAVGTAYLNYSPSSPNGLCFEIPLMTFGGTHPFSLSAIYNSKSHEAQASDMLPGGCRISWYRKFTVDPDGWTLHMEAADGTIHFFTLQNGFYVSNTDPSLVLFTSLPGSLEARFLVWDSPSSYFVYTSDSPHPIAYEPGKTGRPALAISQNASGQITWIALTRGGVTQRSVQFTYSLSYASAIQERDGGSGSTILQVASVQYSGGVLGISFCRRNKTALRLPYRSIELSLDPSGSGVWSASDALKGESYSFSLDSQTGRFGAYWYGNSGFNQAGARKTNISGPSSDCVQITSPNGTYRKVYFRGQNEIPCWETNSDSLGVVYHFDDSKRRLIYKSHPIGMTPSCKLSAGHLADNEFFTMGLAYYTTESGSWVYCPWMPFSTGNSCKAHRIARDFSIKGFRGEPVTVYALVAGNGTGAAPRLEAWALDRDGNSVAYQTTVATKASDGQAAELVAVTLYPRSYHTKVRVVLGVEGAENLFYAKFVQVRKYAPEIDDQYDVWDQKTASRNALGMAKAAYCGPFLPAISIGGSGASIYCYDGQYNAFQGGCLSRAERDFSLVSSNSLDAFYRPIEETLALDGAAPTLEIRTQKGYADHERLAYSAGSGVTTSYEYSYGLVSKETDSVSGVSVSRSYWSAQPALPSLLRVSDQGDQQLDLVSYYHDAQYRLHDSFLPGSVSYDFQYNSFDDAVSVELDSLPFSSAEYDDSLFKRHNLSVRRFGSSSQLAHSVSYAYDSRDVMTSMAPSGGASYAIESDECGRPLKIGSAQYSYGSVPKLTDRGMEIQYRPALNGNRSASSSFPGCPGKDHRVMADASFSARVSSSSNLAAFLGIPGLCLATVQPHLSAGSTDDSLILYGDDPVFPIGFGDPSVARFPTAVESGRRVYSRTDATTQSCPTYLLQTQYPSDGAPIGGAFGLWIKPSAYSPTDQHPHRVLATLFFTGGSFSESGTDAFLALKLQGTTLSLVFHWATLTHFETVLLSVPGIASGEWHHLSVSLSSSAASPSIMDSVSMRVDGRTYRRGNLAALVGAFAIDDPSRAWVFFSVMGKPLGLGSGYSLLDGAGATEGEAFGMFLKRDGRPLSANDGLALYSAGRRYLLGGGSLAPGIFAESLSLEEEHKAAVAGLSNPTLAPLANGPSPLMGTLLSLEDYRGETLGEADDVSFGRHPSLGRFGCRMDGTDLLYSFSSNSARSVSFAYGLDPGVPASSHRTLAELSWDGSLILVEAVGSTLSVRLNGALEGSVAIAPSSPGTLSFQWDFAQAGSGANQCSIAFYSGQSQVAAFSFQVSSAYRTVLLRLGKRGEPATDAQTFESDYCPLMGAICDLAAFSDAPGILTILGRRSAFAGVRCEAEFDAFGHPIRASSAVGGAVPVSAEYQWSPICQHGTLVLAGETVSKLGASFRSVSYSYDPHCRIVGVDDGVQSSYSYDPLGRLAGWSVPGAHSATYSYDADSDIVSAVDTATSESRTFAYDKLRLIQAGQVSVEYGNPESPFYPTTVGIRSGESFSSGFAISYVGPMISKIEPFGSYPVTGAEFAYGGDGLRTSKTSSGIRHDYYWEGGRLIYETETDVLTEAVVHTKRYFYSPLGKLDHMVLDGARYFYLTNAFGDVLAISDGSGNVLVEYSYDPWGRTLSVADSSGIGLSALNPFRYRGYQFDPETGWYYCQSRYYSPEWMRWVTPDGFDYLTFEGFGGHNPYVYCLNNPVTNADESGCAPKWVQWVVGGALILGAIVISIATAGAGGALAYAMGGGFLAYVAGGAIAGAAIGVITGAMIGAGTELISHGFDNFDWSAVGRGALSGLITGAIAGGIFGGIDYFFNNETIARFVSQLDTAELDLANASTMGTLRSIPGLSSSPFASANIAKAVATAASNYNSAYTAFIDATLMYYFSRAAVRTAYFVGQSWLSDWLGKTLSL